TSALERLQGYKDALAQAGIPFDESLVVEGDFRQESGRTAMEQLIEQSHGKPSKGFSAVFAANDLMAVGALTALESHGIAVPKEIAVVGYDDIALASVTRPRLSTVAQPKYEMGALAAEMLLRRMADPGLPRQQEILQPMLVIRDSTLERSARSG
ncbi:MAG: substrate-binding domain-containing protein, partial [Bacillota bacterium]